MSKRQREADMAGAELPSPARIATHQASAASVTLKSREGSLSAPPPRAATPRLVSPSHVADRVVDMLKLADAESLGRAVAASVEALDPETFALIGQGVDGVHPNVIAGYRTAMYARIDTQPEDRVRAFDCMLAFVSSLPPARRVSAVIEYAFRSATRLPEHNDSLFERLMPALAATGVHMDDQGARDEFLHTVPPLLEKFENQAILLIAIMVGVGTHDASDSQILFATLPMLESVSAENRRNLLGHLQVHAADRTDPRAGELQTLIATKLQALQPPDAPGRSAS